ncbi:MAG: hypothetical protein DHS20C15_19910 [Planctomycetota bacterium]|nr:MAG: hypothetical protein DHS20C15_19910 [Planctomycetota bacterium]
MTFQLPKLPYALDALEPTISADTLREHHGAHHKSYIEKTNKLQQESDLTDASLETLVQRADGALLQNAAQAWNHSFYWESMTPGDASEPGAELRTAIDATFGDLKALRELFLERAGSHFGSGWAWLVREKDGRLSVECTHDAGCPLRDGKTPLLVCDLWEHAYYLDHQHDRGAYLEGFWSLIDWARVDQRFAAASTVSDASSQPRTHGAPPTIPVSRTRSASLIGAALLGGLLTLGGCGDDSAENAGKHVDDFAEDVEDAAEDVADEAEDLIDDHDGN